jgi:dihydrofolate reductase
MPLANKIDLTLIPGLYDGDTFFPEIDETCWKKTSEVKLKDFSIVNFERI